MRALPQPGGGDLQGIFCTSSVSCWAVGSFIASGENLLNEVLRWNGSAWSQVAVPSPGGTAAGDSSQLFAVRCTSPRDCWAVGDFQRAGGARFNQALHWNGRNEVLRWNGRKWVTTAVPSPGGPPSRGGFSELESLTCASPASCWSAGAYGTFGSTVLSQLLHWNGSRWSRASIPEPGGTSGPATQQLSAVTCTSAANCWAVGSYIPGGGETVATLNEALHWDGVRWSLIVTPDPGSFDASDISELNADQLAST